MINRTAKRICVLVLAALMAVLWCGAAFADHTVDHDRTGSISVTVRDAATLRPVENSTFVLYCVGLLSEEGYNASYDATLVFEWFAGDINDLTSPTLVPALLDYIKASQVDAFLLESADAQGEVLFEELPLGLYLVVQPTSTATHYRTEAFLVTVPMSDPVTNRWVYDIDATPKVSAKPKPTTPGGKLPQTGGLLWPIPVLALSGIVLFVAGWSRNRRSRHEP